MKIRQKLTVSFTFTVLLILIFLGVTIYYFSYRYRKTEFFNRLDERVEITEKMFLERENLSDDTYELIRSQFLNKLPAETERVFKLEELRSNPDMDDYPEGFINQLKTSGEAWFEADNLQGVGKIFHLPGDDYAVILTAKDVLGISMLDHLRTILVTTLAIGILCVGLVSYFLSMRVLNPLSKKIQKANEISADNLHERLTVYNPDDEIGELAVAFNHLLDRVSEAFEAQRAFIDNASHEMRNPLTSIIGEADLALERERDKAEYIESFQAITAEAHRLNNLVNNLLQLAQISYREVTFRREPLSVNELLTETRDKFDFIHPGHKVSLHLLSSAEPVRIDGNKHLLQTAFINIFDNATKFSFNKEVDASITRAAGYVMIVVRDQGIGIPTEDLPKVTRPFHRAPNVRQIPGTGIGIPLTLKIIELHKGKLSIRSELNVGTTVEIMLPVLA